MKDILLIIGSKSSILKGFKPKKKYKNIITADRTENSENNYKSINIIFDLLFDNSNSEQKIIRLLKTLSFEKIDIIFSSYCNVGLNHSDSTEDINKGLSANIGKPLSLFSLISEQFPEKSINGIFISSIYSIISPNKNNYEKDIDINPLYYGASKAAVNQGLKWLSTRNFRHKFNSIILGPMPKNEVLKNQKSLINNLIKSMPSENFISLKEVNNTINFILDCEGNNLRGTSITLDGGYTIW